MSYVASAFFYTNSLRYYLVTENEIAQEKNCQSALLISHFAFLVKGLYCFKRKEPGSPENKGS